MSEPVFFTCLAVFVLALFLTTSTVRRLIPKLAVTASQPIYLEGPSWHKSKTGTPTMGGVAFLLAAPVGLLPGTALLLASGNREGAISLFLCIAYAVGNGLCGILDDRTKVHRHENQGLTPLQKLLIQTLLAVLFLAARHLFLGDTTTLLFSFGKWDAGLFYYPLSLVALLGTVNCANLTDGIDGLASSVAFGIGVSLFFLSAALFPEVTVVASLLMGISVGFLVYNLHPAKIFMGDTGSLFFGGLCAAGVFALGNPLLLLPVCIVYFLEGLSVILQVLHYKRTGKRIFLMAPLHHHFEKRGWSENRICLCAILLTLLCSTVAYVFFMP